MRRNMRKGRGGGESTKEVSAGKTGGMHDVTQL